MTVLRLVPASVTTAIGPALATVESALLARRDGAAYVEVPVAVVPRLARALAFAGIRAEPCDADLTAPSGLIPAVGMDLSPVPAGLVALDVVRIRRIPLGCATREILRRRFAGLLPAAAEARVRCRALLRGDDVTLAWGRQAWASRAALRSASARRTLRPVVFDRDAIGRAELDGRASSRDEAIARWLFA